MKLILCWRLFIVTLLHTTVTVAIDGCFGGNNHTAYLDWVNEHGSSYTTAVCYNASSSDTTQGVAIHWKIDSDNIYLAVAARATGWVGFGLAEGGGMKGADIVIYEMAFPEQLRDTHVLDDRQPIDDDCQDWVFVESHTEGGFIIFEGYRKLATLDSQDHAIINDELTVITAQRIIAAWGDTDTAVYHSQKKARGSVRWYGGGDELTFVRERLKEQSDGYFELLVPNYTIPLKVTDYASFCFSWDLDLVPQGVPANGTIQVIAAETIVRDGLGPFVHHADVFASAIPSNESRTCLKSGSYGYTVYSWAPGILPFLLPENVGYKMGPGDGDGLQSFRVQIHYTNVEFIENVVDNGGLRVYYSLTPREHELGIFAMGDALSKLEGEPIPAGLSQYDFYCSPDCSKVGLDEPVTVIQELFHMHVDGYAAATYHYRNEELLRQANVDYFDFDQAGLPTIRQQPFTVNPGDSFVSTFYFNSENGTKFGIGTYEEMNKAVFLYYPAKTLFDIAPWSCTYNIELAACNSTMESRTLLSSIEIPRVFGVSPPQCSEKATITVASTSLGNRQYHHIIFLLNGLVLVCLSMVMIPL